MYNKDELKNKIVELIDCKSDDKQEEIIEIINRNVLDPYWSDYIFHSDDYLNEDESINFDLLLDKIFSYESFQL